MHVINVCMYIWHVKQKTEPVDLCRTLYMMSMSISISIKICSVAKIAELLQSPQRRSRVTMQNQEMIVEKEMF